MSDTLFSVTQLNSYIKLILSDTPTLNNIYLKGEISNIKIHTSGHIYMTLKDEKSSINCVMFKSDAIRMKFKPDNGMSVILFGRVSVFDRTGSVQFYANSLKPEGAGDLMAAFEQLKNKLALEGLFDMEKKKPLPRFPEKIGVVTSPTGAAVHDIIRVINARYSGCDIYIYPSLVQGDSAPKQLIRGIEFFNNVLPCDTIIIGRGGGSAEDLWAFNDEGLARSIFKSKIPVISAVGHETDFTICDFVADVRAATPSNAAELATVDALELKSRIKRLEFACRAACRNRLRLDNTRFKALSESRILKIPRYMVDERRLIIDNLLGRVTDQVQDIINNNKQKFVKLALMADGLNPIKALGRGFGFITSQEKAVISSVKQVKTKDRLSITMRDGEILCIVDDITVSDKEQI